MVSVATSFCLLGLVRLAFVRVACVWLGLPILFGGFGARFGGCRCRDCAYVPVAGIEHGPAGIGAISNTRAARYRCRICTRVSVPVCVRGIGIPAVRCPYMPRSLRWAGHAVRRLGLRYMYPWFTVVP